MRRTTLGLLCLSTSVLAGSYWTAAADNPPATPGQIVLRSTALGPMPGSINELSITPDGQHIAVEGNSGSRVTVFIDGNEGPAYGSIVQMP